MKVLHGTWIPKAENEFVQTGAFHIWVETSDFKHGKTKIKNHHPGQLPKTELSTFLVNDLGILESHANKIVDKISPKYFILPGTDSQPLQSWELTRYLEEEPPEASNLQSWMIDCYEVTTSTKATSFKSPQGNPIIKLLNDLHFIALYQSSEIQLGSDLLFWYHYTQAFKQLIFKDQYIPALKYRELPSSQEKRQKKANTFEIYTGWEIISEQYESMIRHYADFMPLACVAGSEAATDDLKFYEKKHYSVISRSAC